MLNKFTSEPVLQECESDVRNILGRPADVPGETDGAGDTSARLCRFSR